MAQIVQLNWKDVFRIYIENLKLALSIFPEAIISSSRFKGELSPPRPDTCSLSSLSPSIFSPSCSKLTWFPQKPQFTRIMDSSQLGTSESHSYLTKDPWHQLRSVASFQIKSLNPSWHLHYHLPEGWTHRPSPSLCLRLTSCRLVPY